MIIIHQKMYKDIMMFLNPAQIVSVWTEEDGLTRVKLSTGDIVYPTESAEVVADMMNRRLNK